MSAAKALARYDSASPNEVTRPIIAATYAGKVAALERFAPSPEWRIVTDDSLGEVWLIEWDRLTIYVRDAGDLALSEALLGLAVDTRRALRSRVIDTARRLGLNPRNFLYPA